MQQILVLGVVGTLFVLFFVVRARKAKQRALAFQGVATSRGMEFDATGKTFRTGTLSGIPLFRKGIQRGVSNVVSGTTEGVQVFLLDYHYEFGADATWSAERNDSDRAWWTVRQIALAARKDGAGIPGFQLKPESRFDKFDSKLGGQDVDFPSDQQFSNLYRLRGDEEEGVRRLFSAEMRQRLSGSRNWSIEGCGEWVVVYRRRMSHSNLETFMMEASAIAATVLGQE